MLQCCSLEAHDLTGSGKQLCRLYSAMLRLSACSVLSRLQGPVKAAVKHCTAQAQRLVAVLLSHQTPTCILSPHSSPQSTSWSCLNASRNTGQGTGPSAGNSADRGLLAAADAVWKRRAKLVNWAWTKSCQAFAATCSTL